MGIHKRDFKKRTHGTRSRLLLKAARFHGGRFRSELVTLHKLERRKISWLSKPILGKLGVAPKPANGSTCPACMTPGQSFELDHMGPWRQYVAAFAGPHISKDGVIKLKHVRMLYNDPENLWWICRDCNGKKSDYISDDGSVPVSGVRGRDVRLEQFYPKSGGR